MRKYNTKPESYTQERFPINFGSITFGHLTESEARIVKSNPTRLKSLMKETTLSDQSFLLGEDGLIPTKKIHDRYCNRLKKANPKLSKHVVWISSTKIKKVVGAANAGAVIY